MHMPCDCVAPGRGWGSICTAMSHVFGFADNFADESSIDGGLMRGVGGTVFKNVGNLGNKIENGLFRIVIWPKFRFEQLEKGQKLYTLSVA